MGLFANDQDEPSGPSRARRILILVPLAVLIVALVFVLLMRRNRVLHKMSAMPEHEESGVCSNEACRRVVAFAMENTDLGFDPCLDFHRHACGRWFAGSTARRSYVDENRLNFSAAVHGALTQLLRRAQPGTVDM
ncbi:neprilysin-like [Rhipicephalus sanguineus]|uniref:neprilysin-like n=1 Tax=Rhipicephalus sanguineus TaxID=34632 RepID=UPI0020C43D45|nr:neprilysin-like [Rhipicephalus sanguineus]